MIYSSRHRRTMTALGVVLALALVLTGVWLVVRSRDGGSTAQPPAEPPASPTAPSTQEPSGPGGSGGSGDGPPPPAGATMTVTVFFHRGQNADPDRVVAVRRTVPRTTRVATASLQALLAGPTAAERHAGYWSHFSAATAGMLRSLQISGGVASADFRDFRSVIPNASSSAGSAALLAELDTTLEQFRTVRTTVYSFNGDVAAFYEWLQREPPAGTTPTLSDAQSVARAFLIRVVGMTRPVSAGTRWRSDYIATADFRPNATGPVTTVALGKGRTTFTVLDVSTRTIRVDTPKSAISPDDLAVVTSPLTVSGAALTFEGNVALRVVRVSGSSVRQLGSGYATGGGDEMRSFSGTVSFTQPGTGTGWMIAFERSAADGTVSKATAVRVAFGPAATS
jgi:hypothetical protein